mmetsp:Transcript_16006/g.32755  ORF Transcript_16006/g.32755 Transcript_16006/m.32755 type:complete len:250 (+) Transcript_16006:251-1000(+)
MHVHKHGPRSLLVATVAVVSHCLCLGVFVVLGVPRLCDRGHHVRWKVVVFGDADGFVDGACCAMSSRGPSGGLDVVQPSGVHEHAPSEFRRVGGLRHRHVVVIELLTKHSERKKRHTSNESIYINWICRNRRGYVLFPLLGSAFFRCCRGCELLSAAPVDYHGRPLHGKIVTPLSCQLFDKRLIAKPTVVKALVGDSSNHAFIQLTVVVIVSLKCINFNIIMRQGHGHCYLVFFVSIFAVSCFIIHFVN